MRQQNACKVLLLTLLVVTQKAAAQCASETVSSLTWPTTADGVTAILDCPDDGQATRLCQGTTFGTPDTTGCQSSTLPTILLAAEGNADKTTAIESLRTHVTGTAGELLGTADIPIITAIINQVGQAFGSLSDNNAATGDAISSVAAALGSSADTIAAAPSSALALSSALTGVAEAAADAGISVDQGDVATVHVLVQQFASFTSLTHTGTGTQAPEVSVPGISPSTSVSLSIVSYAGPQMFSGRFALSGAVSVYAAGAVALTDDFVVKFPFVTTLQSAILEKLEGQQGVTGTIDGVTLETDGSVSVSYTVTTRRRRRLLASGVVELVCSGSCTMTAISLTEVTCSCSSFGTTFVSLLQEPELVQTVATQASSYFFVSGYGLYIILCIALIGMPCLKLPQLEIAQVATAMIAFMLLFVTEERNREDPVTCTAVAISFHYLALVILLLTLLHLVTVSSPFVNVFTRWVAQDHVLLKNMIISWFSPGLFVGLTVLTAKSEYGEGSYCWIDPSDSLIASAIVPLVLIILGYVVVMFLFLRNKDSAKPNQRRPVYCAVYLIFNILVSWGLMVLMYQSPNIFTRMLFVAHHLLSGFIFFVLYFWMNKELRNGLAVRLCCKEPAAPVRRPIRESKRHIRTSIFEEDGVIASDYDTLEKGEGISPLPNKQNHQSGPQPKHTMRNPSLSAGARSLMDAADAADRQELRANRNTLWKRKASAHTSKNLPMRRASATADYESSEDEESAGESQEYITKPTYQVLNNRAPSKLLYLCPTDQSGGGENISLQKSEHEVAVANKHVKEYYDS